MKSKVVKLPLSILALLAAATFGVACGGNGGGNGDECEEGEVKCDDGLCHECCDDLDCTEEEWCNEDYVCELICMEAGEDCSKDPAACCEGLACDIFTNECMTACETDADCASRTEIPFYEDLLCKNGACDFDHCTIDNQCPGGQVCFNGDCVTKPSCEDIDSCAVLPASAVTQQGTVTSFSATAYLTSGALAPGMTFEWASDDDTIASVAGGEVTGGAATGTAVITATVSGCTVSCDATVSNYGAVAGGETRVVVVDELGGFPVEGATVTVGAEAPATTDAQGVATVAVELSEGNPADITVSKLEYNYVSLRAVESNDVIVHMTELYHIDDFTADPPTEQAGGIRGTFDFNLVPCEEGHTCDVLIGLGGLSIPGNLVNLNLDLLIGGMIVTDIELGGTSETIPLPAGLTLALNTTAFKGSYTPTGVPGSRVAWGLGGKLDLSTLIDMLGPVISGGGEDIDVGSIVASLLPLFGDFYTAMVPNVNINPIPKVEDVDNIDDDEDTTHVPDYDNFPELNMALKVGMEKQVSITAPTLPANPAGGYYYDGVIVLAGVIVRGAGLVPLGISAGLDSTSEEDQADGVIDAPIVVKVADVAGRIPESQVQRVVVALALNVSGLMGDGDQGLQLGGQVHFLDDFSGSVSLDEFVTPAVGTYDDATRTLSMTEVPATSYHQVIFSAGNEINWHVIGEWAAGDYTLPDAPAAGDRAKDASFISIQLADGLTFQDIAAFNSTNLADLVEVVESFVFSEVPSP